MTEQPNETQAEADRFKATEDATEPWATLIVRIYPTHTHTTLQSNPGDLGYGAMATELKVAAEHIHRLAPDAARDVAYIDTEKL